MSEEPVRTSRFGWIAVAVLVLTVLIVVLPRMRPDTIQLNLHNGRPVAGVQAFLISAPSEVAGCTADALRQVTDLRGEAIWQRTLAQQKPLGFGPQADHVALCAEIGSRLVLLWKRTHLEFEERTDVSCEWRAGSAIQCRTEGTVTLGQTAYLAALLLLIALLCRLFWNWRVPAVPLTGLVLLLLVSIVCMPALWLHVRVTTQLFLMASLIGALAGMHMELTRVLRKAEEDAWASQTPNPGASSP